MGDLILGWDFLCLDGNSHLRMGDLILELETLLGWEDSFYDAGLFLGSWHPRAKSAARMPSHDILG